MSNTATENQTTTYAPATELYLASALVVSEDSLAHFAKVIESHGAEIKKSESLGQKQLFHPINKHNSLYLVSVFFTVTPKEVPAIEAELRRDDMIERVIITTWRADINQPMRSARTRSDRSPREKEQE